jgi:glycosyltransferase involved in cell wall biosynthesis
MSRTASIVLYCYNGEPYVQDAVASLLEQDWQNLEIVLSDDGSTDRTFEIMEAAARDYHGPHRVLLNRNPVNLGIGSQINAAVAMTTGELILLANGDDISEPYRVRCTVEAWLENGRPMALWSDLAKIDAGGRPLGSVVDCRVHAPSLAEGMQRRFGGVRAASLALSREVFTCFGPLQQNLILEDNALLLRALLLGKVHHIAEPLVRYRIHPNNISHSWALPSFDEWRVRNLRITVWTYREGVKAYLQMLRDIYQPPAEAWPADDLKRARWIGMEKLLEHAILHDFYADDRSLPLAERWRSLGRLAWLLLKAGVKRALPFIEHRNERLRYERSNDGYREQK